MASASSQYRKKLKEERPDDYARYLEREKARVKNKRDEEKKRLEEEPQTRAQIMMQEEKKKQQRARSLACYYKRKAEQERQTRSVKNDTPQPVATTPTAKRPKDMGEEERRAYRASMRKKQRDARSSQKKTAEKMMRRKRYHERKKAEVSALAAETPSPASNSSARSRLPQKAYNLNHHFKTRTKQLNLSSEEYAQTALNLLNPQTPEKRIAIASLQERHPCRVLFSCHDELAELEEELGIAVLDEEESNKEAIPCSNATHELIKSFYLQECISRMLPHARYSTKNGAARVMVMTLREAHSKFLDSSPSVQAGLTLFQQQRPKNVRLLGSVPIESCLCIYCTNIRLKVNSLNRQLGDSGQLPCVANLLNFITCPVPKGQLNAIQCIDGECDRCRDRMRPVEIYCRDIIYLDGVSWVRWSRGESGKMEPATRMGSVRDLLAELKVDLDEPSRGVSFAQHLYVAYWQYQQYKHNRRNPSDGEVVMVQDFAENRKAVYAEEIKSAHFGKNQVSVHPMVCFYRKGDEVMRHSILVFSDDIGHDYHAVNCFTLAAIDIIKKCGSFCKLTIWSDGCASQYKGKGAFADLSLITGMEVQRCFYGSEHGKGEADGETGVLSQCLKRASAAGSSFGNAEAMVNFLSSNHGINKPLQRREYLVVNKINRERPETEVQTIPGTRRYHQFRRLGPYIIQARRLACFCTACIQGDHTNCMNMSVVGQYVTHKLKPSAQTLLNTAFVEDPQEQAIQPSCSKPTQVDGPEVKIGDYLHISCDINRLTKRFYAVVIPSPVPTTDFYVRFFRKASGNAYVFGDVPDEGLVYRGPPDNYSWRIVPAETVRIDNRGHYYFN